ncbi:MAG: hypothetical protein HYV34_00405 [Candidatus Kerfeldbacteria bacterium]|nr:hypothetical protein [Candidatus Kerfeldbacteria bacterium]
MNSTFQILLILHVLAGVLGILFFLCAFFCLARPHRGKWRVGVTLLGTLSFWIAWIAGGAYYVKRYGSAVKPIIMKGSTPWAHTIFMEAKEHLFLFLPFLSVAALLLVWLAGQEIDKDEKLRARAQMLVGLIIALGIFMTFSGIVISAAGGRVS